MQRLPEHPSQRSDAVGGWEPARAHRVTAPDRAAPGRGDRRPGATSGFDRRSWRRFRRDPTAVAGLVILVAIACFALGANLIAAYVTGFSPDENHLAAKLTPPFTDG